MLFSSISQIHVKINLVFLCSKDLWGGWPGGSQLLCYSTVHRVQCNGTRVSWCSGLSSCVSCPKSSVKNLYGNITISALSCAVFCIWNCSDPLLQIHSCWTWLFTLLSSLSLSCAIYKPALFLARFAFIQAKVSEFWFWGCLGCCCPWSLTVPVPVQAL